MGYLKSAANSANGSHTKCKQLVCSVRNKVVIILYLYLKLAAISANGSHTKCIQGEFENYIRAVVFQPRRRRGRGDVTTSGCIFSIAKNVIKKRIQKKKNCKRKKKKPPQKKKKKKKKKS